MAFVCYHLGDARLDSRQGFESARCKDVSMYLHTKLAMTGFTRSELDFPAFMDLHIELFIMA